MARKKLEAVYLDSSDFGRWNSFVAQSSTGSIYSSSDYLEALCAATGGSFKILAVLKGDQILGGVGLYEETRPYGRVIANRLLLYYNGMAMNDFTNKYPSERTSRELAVKEAIAEELDSAGAGRVLLHNRSGISDVRPFLNRDWNCWPSYTYEVAIDDLEQAWGRVEQNLRRLIERCRKNGVTFSSDDDFEAFYDMHLSTASRKGAPLYLNRDSFRRYFEILRDKNLCRLYFARLNDGKPVAVQLTLLGDHKVTHTVCAAAEPEYLNLGTTPFLRWQAFEDLNKLGYAANDLTDAALNPVTRFKGQLGGDLKTNLVLRRADSRAFAGGELLVKAAKKILRPPYRLMKRITDRG